ncbi:hypothetical protein [Luedemannella helvata]|uniref:Uncharacterized protein n=1 Tax=Luedemannella helvata TaxID=349315 RepID=A0ABP4W4F0_9ACTN
MGQQDSGHKERRRMLRSKVARILLVSAFGVLTVSAGFASRPITYMLVDTTWSVGEATSSVPLD